VVLVLALIEFACVSHLFPVVQYNDSDNEDGTLTTSGGSGSIATLSLLQLLRQRLVLVDSSRSRSTTTTAAITTTTTTAVATVPPDGWHVQLMTFFPNTTVTNEIWIHPPQDNSPPKLYRNCGSGRTTGGGYRNRIVFYEKYSAGLNDRRQLLQFLTSIAQFLCAKVVLADPPSGLLSVHHNNDQSVNETLSWSDFFIYTPWIPDDYEYDDDDDDDNNGSGSGGYTSLVLDYKEEQQQQEQQQAATVQVQSTIHNKMNYVPEINEIINLSFHTNQSFTWTIRGPMFPAISKSFQKHFRHLEKQTQQTQIFPFEYTNLYTQQHYGYNVQRAVQLLLQRLYTEFGVVPAIRQEESSSSSSTISLSVSSDTTTETGGRAETSTPVVMLGSWHIRRGDAVKVCNTELDQLAQFVNCSFADVVATTRASSMNETTHRTTASSSLPPSIVVFMTSDEKDPTYRLGILNLFDPYDNILAVDLDEWLQKQLATVQEDDDLSLVWPVSYHNNYHLFELEMAVLDALDLTFQIEHRRKFSCPVCQKITIPSSYR
jgi:hypothetical protein